MNNNHIIYLSAHRVQNIRTGRLCCWCYNGNIFDICLLVVVSCYFSIHAVNSIMPNHCTSKIHLSLSTKNTMHDRKDGKCHYFLLVVRILKYNISPSARFNVFLLSLYLSYFSHFIVSFQLCAGISSKKKTYNTFGIFHLLFFPQKRFTLPF